jgi:hypothetical protein
MIVSGLEGVPSHPTQKKKKKRGLPFTMFMALNSTLMMTWAVGQGMRWDNFHSTMTEFHKPM